MLGGKGGEAIEEKRRDPRAEVEADGREDGEAEDGEEQEERGHGRESRFFFGGLQMDLRGCV